MQFSILRSLATKEYKIGISRTPFIYYFFCSSSRVTYSFVIEKKKVVFLENTSLSLSMPQKHRRLHWLLLLGGGPITPSISLPNQPSKAKSVRAGYLGCSSMYSCCLSIWSIQFAPTIQSTCFNLHCHLPRQYDSCCVISYYTTWQASPAVACSTSCPHTYSITGPVSCISWWLPSPISLGETMSDLERTTTTLIKRSPIPIRSFDVPYSLRK